MNASTVRLKKEARALFWPWCAVTVAGALPVILLNSYTKKLNRSEERRVGKECRL